MTILFKYEVTKPKKRRKAATQIGEASTNSSCFARSLDSTREFMRARAPLQMAVMQKMHACMTDRRTLHCCLSAPSNRSRDRRIKPLYLSLYLRWRMAISQCYIGFFLYIKGVKYFLLIFTFNEELALLSMGAFIFLKINHILHSSVPYNVHSNKN